MITLARDNLPPIRFLVAPGDPRDLLDYGRRPAADTRSRGARLRSHAAAVSVGAAGVAANPRAPHTRALALVAFAVGGGEAGAGRRCGSRRGAGRAGSVLVADVAGLRGRSRSAAKPIRSHAANRVRRERRRGARSGRAVRRPGPRVGPSRGGVPRRASSGSSAPDIPACHRVDRRGAGSGTAAGNRRRLHHVARQSSARPVPGAAGA